MRDAYAAAGSATQLAHVGGRLDSVASVPEAGETVVAAVATASERDTASEDRFTVTTVTAKSVEIDSRPTRAEVSG